MASNKRVTKETNVSRTSLVFAWYKYGTKDEREAEKKCYSINLFQLVLGLRAEGSSLTIQANCLSQSADEQHLW